MDITLKPSDYYAITVNEQLYYAADLVVEDGGVRKITSSDPFSIAVLNLLDNRGVIQNSYTVDGHREFDFDSFVRKTRPALKNSPQVFCQSVKEGVNKIIHVYKGEAPTKPQSFNIYHAS